MPRPKRERSVNPLETEPPVADTTGHHSAESPGKPPPSPRNRGREGSTGRAGARNVPPRQQETGDFTSGTSGALDPEGQAGRIVRPEPVTEEGQHARKDPRGGSARQENALQENERQSDAGDERFSGTID